MAKLTAKARRALPDSAFAGPGRSYPVEDKGHAQAAIARAKEFHPAGEKKIIARAQRVIKGKKKDAGKILSHKKGHRYSARRVVSREDMK